MDKTFLLLLGALAGFTAVAFGAFGAHALRGRLTPEMLAAFETGVRYQMYHALAVIAVGLMLGRIGRLAVCDRGVAVHRWHRALLGQPVRPRADRCHDIRGHYSSRRPRLPRRLGLLDRRGVLNRRIVLRLAESQD